MKSQLPVFILLALLAAPGAFAQSYKLQHAAKHMPVVGEMPAAGVLGKLAAHAAAERFSILTKKQLHVWDGAEWVPQGQDVFAYDGLRRTEELSHVWSGSSWENDTRTTYSFDGSDRLVELREQWDSGQQAFMAVDKYEYEYAYDWTSGARIIVGMLYQTWDGGSWVDDDRTTYTFSQDGKATLTGGTTERWDGAAWVPTERFSLAVAENDVVQSDQVWNGTEWENDTRTVFHNVTIPELQAQVEEFTLLVLDYMGLSFASILLPGHTSQMWDGTAWVNSDRVVHQSSTGQPDEILYQAWTGSEWETSMRQIISYRGERQPLAITFASFLENDWYAVLNEEYEYDILDDLIQVTVDLPEDTEDTYSLEPALRYTFGWEHVVTGVDDESMPDGFALAPAYPNPFNPATKLTYQIDVPGHVSLRVYDALGRLVTTLVDGHVAAGLHQVTFEADVLPGGTYLVRFEAGDRHHARAVTLVK